jgi:2'-5' RNA ligase
MNSAGEATTDARITVWALPKDSDRLVLQRVIDRLAGEGGTQPFAPHITIASSTIGDELQPVAGDMEAALADFPRFEVTTGEIAASNEWFRSLVFVIDETEQLAELRVLTLRVLKTSDDNYWPHLSILYGDLDPAKKKLLIKTAAPLLPMTIKIDEVALVDITASYPSAWRLIRAWHLG